MKIGHPQLVMCSLASQSNYPSTADVGGGEGGFASLSAAAGYQVAMSTTLGVATRFPCPGASPASSSRAPCSPT